MFHKGLGRLGTFTIILILAVLAMAASVQPALALEDKLARGRKMISADLVDPVSAAAILSGISIPAPYTPAVSVPPEISTLARGLKNDPDLIYAFMHDTIRFDPGYGSAKGALGTLLDRSGNAFDQSELMVALLRAAGIQASFVHGTIQLTGAQASNWLETTNNVDTVKALLARAGIPFTISPASGNTPVSTVEIDHVWVKARIGGADYVFDPASKAYEAITGIDLASAMGYSRSVFLSAAGGDVHVSPDTATNDYTYVEGLDRAAVRNALQGYATSLIDHVRTNMPVSDIRDVVGGVKIEPVTGQVRQTSLPYEYSSLNEWSDIPDNYKTHLHIECGGIDVRLRATDVYAHRLFMKPAGSNLELYLDGALVSSGEAASALVVEVDHPYAAADDSGVMGTYGDQQGMLYGVREGKVAFVTSFGYTGRGTMDKHRRDLKIARQSGLQAGTDEMTERVLNVVALNYTAQLSQSNRLAAQVTDVAAINHHMVGIIMQRPGADGSDVTLLDLGLCRSSFASLTADETIESPAFLAYADRASILESGVLDQTQKFGGISAAKVLDMAAASNYKIIKATRDNWTHILSLPDLDLAANAPGLVARIERIIQADESFHAIIPVADTMQEGSWIGQGVIVTGVDGDGSSDFSNVMHLMAGRKGAVCNSVLDDGSPTPDLSCIVDDNGANEKCEICEVVENIVGDAPVNGSNGDYFHHYSDLTLGNGANALTFSRSYYAKNRFEDQGMGPGWGHNHSAFMARTTDGFQTLGEQSAVKSAAGVAALFVAWDILAAGTDIDKIVLASLIDTWLMDQITENTVTISFPGGSNQFFKFLDGTFGKENYYGSDVLDESPDGGLVMITADRQFVAFDAQGQMVSKTDANGNATTYTYDASGRVSGISNGFGYSLTFTYDGGNLTQVSGGGLSVAYGYDENGNMVSSTDGAGHTMTYQYGTNHLLTHVFKASDQTDPYVVNTYDEMGTVLTQTVAGTTDTFYVSPFRTEKVDATGHSKIWKYDTDWNPGKTKKPIQITDETGQTVQYQYDDLMRVTRVVYPEGNAVEYTYDERNNPITKTVRAKDGSASLTTRTTWHPDFNKPATITDPLDRVTSFGYDSNGNLISVTSPATSGGLAETTMTYNGQGLPETVTAPDGRVTTMGYDAAGNLASITEDSVGLALTSTFGYDSAGNVTSMTDPLGHTTGMSYDGLRRIIQAVAPQPFGYVTNFGYDADGNANSVERTGPPVQTASATYTLSGNISRSLTPLGHPTDYTYDNMDRLRTVTDAENRSVEYQYDAAGRVTSIINPAGDPEARYTYTPNGRVGTITDAGNNTTTYTYDKFDRLTQVTFPDGSTETYTLDDAGRVTEMQTRGGQTVAFTYDALDRVLTKTVPGGGTYTYTYDLAGKILSCTDSTGSTTYGYDTAGRLISVTHPGGKIVSYRYDAGSRRIRLTYPDDSYAAYTYDELGRPTGVFYDVNDDQTDPAPQPVAAYSYDELSRRVFMAKANSTGASYTHDLDDRLTALIHGYADGGVGFAYGYDQTGRMNRIEVSDPRFEPLVPTGDEENFTPGSLNQYTAAKGEDLSYDGNGNLSNDGTNQYTYNAENLLIAAMGEYTSSYAYDAHKRRISKTVNDAATTYLYDGELVIAEYDAGGTMLRKFLFGPDNAPIFMEGADNRNYYHADALGSIIALSNASGEFAETYAYSSWGQVVNGSSVGNPYMFTGKRLDSETGLYYYRGRQYDPNLRRFLQPDPVGYDGGFNLYAYADNDPWNYVDPARLIGEMLNLAGAGKSDWKDAFYPVVPNNVSFIKSPSAVNPKNVGLMPFGKAVSVGEPKAGQPEWPDEWLPQNNPWFDLLGRNKSAHEDIFTCKGR